MKTVKIRDVVIGEGTPKICVPLVGISEFEIINQAKAANELPCELIEWRADFLKIKGYKNKDLIIEIVEKIKKVCEKPIILTVRTESEGGKAKMDSREYYNLIRDLAAESKTDIIDIQAFDNTQGFNAEKIEFIVGMAHSCDKKVILSNHDFKKTPSTEEITRRLWIMQELKADIPKIALMPKTEADVLKLLDATKIIKENYCKVPFIALSMGELGKNTRICGGSFGAAITFASGEKASAPGQIDAKTLKSFICEYY